MSEVYGINGAISDTYASIWQPLNAWAMPIAGWVTRCCCAGAEHLLRAAASHYRYSYHMLTGHIMFQQAGLIAVTLFISATPCGRPLSAPRFWFRSTGHYLQHDVQADTGSHRRLWFSIGHQQQFASWIAYKVAPFLAKKRKALKTSNCLAG